MRLAKSFCGLVTVLGILLASLVPGSWVQGADPVTDAIDRGVEYLMGQLGAEQLGGEGRNQIGQLALETYALVVAGISVNDPQIRDNFDILHARAVKTRHTYTLACYIFALDAAISQIEHDLLILQPPRIRERFRDNPRIGREYRPYLQKAVQMVAQGQNDDGAWRYNMGAKDFDNSNVQFAVLALGVGVKRNVPIEPSVWEGVVKHFLKCQQTGKNEVKGRITLMTPEERGARDDGVTLIPKDGGRSSSGSRRRPGSGRRGEDEGRTVVVRPAEPEVGMEDLEVYQRGWSYTNDRGYRWNMTCAGLSSLLLARDSLRGRMGPQEQDALNAAIRDGYGWLMANWKPTQSYYGIYSLEKVADIGHVRLFDGHDWYKIISNFLVEQQGGDGSWPGGKSHGESPRVATSFALLVLNRATSLLTMNPASRIMISGRSEGLNAPNDRSWVYVPDLDTTVHYPSLIRTIRLRPSAKLLSFLENIVESYPAEWQGELIPELAKVRDAIKIRRARDQIEEYLASITGYEYDDWEKYLVWHRRWERVILIGSERKKERIPDLIQYYRSTNKSFPLKKTVIWALIQCKAREAIPLFLADLENDDADVRLAAYNAFKSFFIDYPPPFDATASRSVREKQIAKIRDWYSKQKSARS